MSERVPRTRVAVVLPDGDKLLLVRHAKPGATYWLLPGGGLDWGETLEEAAKRELFEETGLEMEVVKPIYLSEAIAPNKVRHILNVTVLGRLTGGTLKMAEEDILAEVAWVPIAELSSLTLYPAIAPHILRSWESGFDHDMRYLGSMWT